MKELKITIYYLLFSVIFFLSCTKSDRIKRNENIEVNLSLTNNLNTYFDYRSDQMIILSSKKLFPKYYKKKIESYRNKTGFKSFTISAENSSGNRYSREILFKERFKRSNDFLEKKGNEMLKNLNKYEINTLTAIDKGKQIVILDENNNKDFRDDKKLVFDENFRYSHNNRASIIDTLPIINIKYGKKIDSVRYSFKRKAQIYPYSNFTFLQFIKDSLTKQTALMLKFKDYWAGTLKFNDSIFDIGIQGIGKYPIIMIKLQNLKYGNDIRYNQNFEYHLKDTFSVGEKLFLIDSIIPDRTKLFLKKVTLKRKYFGRRIGNEIENLKLVNLNKESFNLSDVNFKNKKYILIDVWGTWCLPCLKLTPELRRINKEHSNKVSLLGVAKDDSLKKVKEYVLKNKMDWTHAYLDVKKDNSFIRELKILSYPTFILVNDKHTIIYRGSGEQALKEIEKIIIREE